MTATRSVAVLYESPQAQEMAVGFCDGLVSRFWIEEGFDINWWAVGLLERASAARLALEKAANADFVVIALAAETSIPYYLEAWLEKWLVCRGEREGALVGLIAGEGKHVAGGASKHLYLRRLAHRAQMDYLTQIPPCVSPPEGEDPDVYVERAQEMTSVLKEILERPSSPVEALPPTTR
jgi:hypothetical protein